MVAERAMVGKSSGRGVQRILLIGMSGAGKSTAARVLGEKTGFPVFHLDNDYHAPGWVPRPREVVQQEFETMAARECWIADGNYFRLTEKLRQRADVILLFQFGRVYCMAQVMKRFFLHKTGLERRRDIAEGFDEKVSFALLKWIWDYPNENLPKWRTEMEKFPEKVIIFRNRKEVKAWLASL